MKIPTRGRYGLRAMVELAKHYGEGPILLREVAQRQRISLMYLEQLIKPLVVSGLIRTERGSHGGVWLAKPAKDVTIGEILDQLIGKLAPVDCVLHPDSCKHWKTCATRDIWCEMKEALDNILKSRTLQELLDAETAKREKMAAEKEALPS
jgi:Rrf2 family transcriptional regulator, cysteine metabolism repressor